VKEEAYRAKMDTHGKAIQEIEKKLKNTIDGTVSKTLKEAESEKAKFTRVADRVKELSTQINGYMKKFDEIKEEMGDNSRKFEAYQQQVETKKVEIRSLEVEIENIQLVEKRQLKVQQEVQEERQRMVNQVETLRKLSNALKCQLENIK
jgi:chromosome segregation ATPase